MTTRARRTTNSRGFTLIELLVVVGIIGILAAVAIPVFMNQQAKAHDATVKSDVTNLAKQVEAAFADGATSLTRNLETITDGTRTWNVTTTGDGWNVYGTQAGYCITGWADRGKYTSAAPLVYDSTRGGLGSGADCSTIAELPANFIEAGYTAPTPPPLDQMSLVYDLALGCENRQLVLPLAGSPSGTIDWGDGSPVEPMTASPLHTYAEVGTFTVTLTGTIPQVDHFSDAGARSDAPCLTSVPLWGRETATTSMSYAFRGARNLRHVAAPPPTVTNFGSAFWEATSFNGDISDWDTSRATNMWGMFSSAISFNGEIGSWDVSRVTTMESMFSNAVAFNQDISGWNTGSVTTMAGMFQRATSFNQPLGTWNTRRVTSMNLMFSGASSFNHPLNGWNTAALTNAASMFQNASVFNQPLNAWDVSKVTSMSRMFEGAAAFNRSLNSWDTSRVTSMAAMFTRATAFNGDISTWNTANVRDMSWMFERAASFNQDIGNWITSSNRNLSYTFRYATAFNQDISAWNTGAVSNMEETFAGAASFNQNIAGWNTANVSLMRSMFDGATAMQADLRSWDVSKITSASDRSAFNSRSPVISPIWLV